MSTLNSVRTKILSRVEWDVSTLINTFSHPLKSEVNDNFKALEKYVETSLTKKLHTPSESLKLSIPSFEIRTDQNSNQYTSYIITVTYLTKTYVTTHRYSSFLSFHLKRCEMKREAGEGRVKFPGKRRGRYYGDDVRRIKLEEWCKSGENVFLRGLFICFTDEFLTESLLFVL